MKMTAQNLIYHTAFEQNWYDNFGAVTNEM